MSEKVTTIRLAGKLAKRFGKTHRFVVGSAADAVNALCRMLPGFEAELMTSKDRGLTYAVFVGKENIGKESLRNPSGGKDIVIAPVIIGSKRGGILQTIFGIILIVVGVFTENPALIQAGIAMTAGGVLQMLSPQPKNLSSGEGPDNGRSYNFNGAVNTSIQGVPVSVLYGQLIVGSAVISGGIYAEDQQ